MPIELEMKHLEQNMSHVICLKFFLVRLMLFVRKRKALLQKGFSSEILANNDAIDEESRTFIYILIAEMLDSKGF